jgi:hypothetical protein
MRFNKISILILILITTNCSDKNDVDIKISLLNKFWTLDKIKRPDSNVFEPAISKPIYYFNENGICLRKTPYQNGNMDKADTIRKYISWRFEGDIIQLIGNDTITIGTDTLIFHIPDWKVLEMSNNFLKVDRLNSDGLSTNSISILTTK